MLRPLPLFGNGLLPPAVWPRPNSRAISQQIDPNRRSLPAQKSAADAEFACVASAAASRRSSKLRRRSGRLSLGGTFAVAAMIANLGDHTGDEITLEEVEWK